MKFTQLKQNIKYNIENCYLLTGEDSFLIQNARKTIFNACNISNEQLNHIVYSNETTHINDVLAACQTLPFMCDKKIIEYRIIEKVQSSDIKVINDYIEKANDSTCFVIIESVDSQLSKNIKGAEVVDCSRLEEQTLLSWIANTLKQTNKQIDLTAGKKLIQYCNFYLSKINAELQKLMAYCKNTNIITEKEIEELVTKDFEYQIYELADAVVRKDTIKAYKILTALRINKDNTNVIISSLYNYFRRLFYIAITPQLNNIQLAENLGCKEFAVKMAKNSVRIYSQRKLKYALEICAKAEQDLKTGMMSKDINNELLLLRLLNL